MKERGHNVCSTAPKVTCEVFEDNEGAMELAHINQICHNFISCVSSGDVEMFPIDAKVQIEDKFVKPPPKEQFLKL